MPRQTSKSIDSWAALLAKELAPAKRPENGKRMIEVSAILKKAGLPYGKMATWRWLGKQVKSGAMKAVKVMERDESGRKKPRVYYVPTK